MELLKKISMIILLMIFAITTIIFAWLFNNEKSSKNKLKLHDENIVFFGDSITYGYNIKEFFDDHYVVNSGINGDQTTDLLDNIDKRLYEYNPSKVFLLIGINDIYKNRDEKEIVDNIRKIVKQIKLKRKNTEIFVESVYPINRNAEEPTSMFKNENLTNEAVISLNKRIQKLCKEENITYINVFASLADDDGSLKKVYTKDGVHLTDLGYHKVTNILKKYL